ncbi:MAG: MFS transporter, partial [Chloroflexi bacterium]|nr:MFS transporter [Chloroflexota bacterium]
ADRRPTFTSLYSTIMNVGAFILPLVGVQLADLIGIPTMFLIAAGLRLLGGLAFTLWPVRAEEPAPAQP